MLGILKARQQAQAIAEAIAFRSFDRKKAEDFVVEAAKTVSARGDAELHLALWISGQLAGSAELAGRREVLRRYIERYRTYSVPDDFTPQKMETASAKLCVDAETLAFVAREAARRFLHCD